MTENKNVKNKKKQQSKTPEEPSIKKWRERLSGVWKKAPGIAASAIGIILGFIAAWKGFGQWWFGFQLSAWVLIIIAVALNIVWLTAVCGYLAGLEKNKPKLPRSNTVFMIALPALVLGILFGYFAIRWRLADKIVILVEPFDYIGQVQDGNASGKELKGIAEIIKWELDRAIQEQDKRLDVRVALGKRHEQQLSEEALLEERALEYRADMVISGWYVERGDEPNKEFLVCPKFQVVRVPKPLPAVFRARASVYPEAIVFSEKEIENLNMNFTLKKLLKFGKQLTYEPTLVLGAGAYASGDWKTAQQLFADALSIIEEPNSPENGSKTNDESPKKELETNKNDASSIENENLKEDANTVSAATDMESSEKDSKAKKRDESRVRHIEGDKALLHLYIGHCLMNRNKYENAILKYDDAIEAGKKIPISDMRYGEILASAYLARGVAYRQVNAFELARRDFETAGGHLPTSLGLRPLRVEEARFVGGDREKLEQGAEKYRSRGEKYLIQREYKHAQAHLEMSVELYRTLMKGMPTPFQKRYGLKLAKSLVRLGEIHNRLALPELTDDENNERAIKYLNEAINLTRKFDNQKNLKMLEIRAVGLRHLGEAYQSKDKIKDVKIAFKYHEEAKEIWENTMKPNKPEGAANERIRIGNVHRRLEDLLPYNEKYPNLKKAVDEYRLSVRMLASVNNDGYWMLNNDSYRILFSAVRDQPENPNTECLRDSVKRQAEANITAHHLANSLRNLAETKLWLGGDPNTGDPNMEDLPTICKLLDFATECYERAMCKMEVEENPKWIEKIRINERNQSLKDDLGWCMTLHSYVLLKIELANKTTTYESIEERVKKAMEYFEESGNYKEDKDKSEIITNRLILSITQVKLDQKDKARETFHEGCLSLRNLTRKEKKVWYIDYIRDLMDDFKQEYPLKLDDHFSNLHEWLKADIVRKGRYALDQIINDVEKQQTKNEGS